MKINEILQTTNNDYGRATIENISSIFENLYPLLESASSDLKVAVEKLKNIVTGNDPDYKHVKISIRGSALKAILSKKELRIVNNVLELLDEFRKNPVDFESRMIGEKKMRAHRIKQSRKNDKEYDKSTKVDILGKNLGLLFHSGPKKVANTSLGKNELYIVAFGSHSDLGT